MKKNLLEQNIEIRPSSRGSPATKPERSIAVVLDEWLDDQDIPARLAVRVALARRLARELDGPVPTYALPRVAASLLAALEPLEAEGMPPAGDGGGRPADIRKLLADVMAQ